MVQFNSAPAGIAGWGGSRYTKTNEGQLNRPKEGCL